MGTKTKPGKFDCLSKAHDDEPVFVLLARDPQAAPMVDRWAYSREREIDHGHRADTPAEREQIAEARECADAMRVYHGELRQARDDAAEAATEAAAKTA